MTSNKEKVYATQLKTKTDEIFSIVVKRVTFGDETNDFYNNVSNGIEITVKSNGDITLCEKSGDWNYIYFHVNEIEYLESAIKAARAAKELSNG